MKILAVIPARGGSKGILRKNLVEICGKPLISYTIEAAVNACNIDRVVVSTEDEEISKLSKSYGVEVIKRPIELATDESTTLSVLQHVKKILHEESYIPDAILTLQPTSPLRTNRHIDEAIDLFSKDKNADCLVSCIQVPHIYHPLSVMKKNTSGYLESYLDEEKVTRRQDKSQVFARNGAAIYITKISKIEEYVFGGKLLPYYMDEKSSIDIDTQLDLEKAKTIIKKMKLIYKRIKNRLLLEVDLLLWWNQVKKIQFKKKRDEKKKIVLFCNLMTMPATAKIESILAAFIARKNYSIYILLKSRYRYIEKLFSIVVNVNFIYFDDYITKEVKEDSAKFVEDYFLKNKTLLVDYEYLGYRVGKNVYSKALRNLRVGKIEHDNSEHCREIKSIFIESIVAINIAKIIHKTYSFDLVVFIEKGYTPSGEIYDSCILEKINVVQWLGAPQSDHFLFKRYDIKNRAIHPLALSDESWEKIKNSNWSENSNKKLINKLKSHYEKGAWFNRQQLQNNKKIYSKKEIQEKINLNKEKKTAVIFSHILYDATFFYGDSIFNDYSEWLIESVRCAIKNNHLNWLIKVHPVNVWRSKMDGAKLEQLEFELLEKEFGELPENISFIPADTDINTFSLFNCIDYGLTVRGTIGMELPCFGIPVITAGSGRYSNRGFTYDPKTIEEFNSTLLNLHKMPSLDEEIITLARKYAYGTFFLRPFKVNSFELNFHSNTYNIDALKQDTFLDKKLSVKECEDVNTIVDWMLYSKKNDLINKNINLL